MVVRRPARGGARAPRAVRARTRAGASACSTPAAAPGYNLLALSRARPRRGDRPVAEAIAFCRERGVRAVRARLLRLPFADAAFDAVTSFDVIYHDWVTDDRAAVAEMARVLRPGGVLLSGCRRSGSSGGPTTPRCCRGAATRSASSGARRGPPACASSAPPTATRCSSRCCSRGARSTAPRRDGSDVGFLPRPARVAFRGLIASRPRSCGTGSASRSARAPWRWRASRGLPRRSARVPGLAAPE